MSWSKPATSTVWQAIETYLRIAYAGGKPPSAVTQRLETLRNMPAENIFDCGVMECDEAKTRYALRLGNRAYPHMKLVIERSPDGQAHLFRADTHDRHIRPAPGSRECAAFSELMRMNQTVAEQIESEWAKDGLATFKSYLRRDLEARQHSHPHPPQHPQQHPPPPQHAHDVSPDRPSGKS